MPASSTSTRVPSLLWPSGSLRPLLLHPAQRSAGWPGAAASPPRSRLWPSVATLTRGSEASERSCPRFFVSRGLPCSRVQPGSASPARLERGGRGDVPREGTRGAPTRTSPRTLLLRARRIARCGLRSLRRCVSGAEELDTDRAVRGALMLPVVAPYGSASRVGESSLTKHAAVSLVPCWSQVF